MGLFSRRSESRPAPASSLAVPVASGRQLSSKLGLDESLAALDAAVRTLNAPPYQHMPALAPAGYTWLDDGPEPDCVMTLSDEDGHPIMATFWRRVDGTRSGLFPLGSGDDRLQRLPVIGYWKQQDPSLSSTGVLPARLIQYEVPNLPADYYANILILGGFPISDVNQRVMRAHVTMLFKLKAYQYISSQDQRLASRFMDEHSNSSPEQLMRKMATWEKGLIPYIQELPGRMQGILLEEKDAEVWKQLERY